jgi:hypothetical protein
LIEAGFLARHYTWSIKTGGAAKRSLIRIIDNYTRFYFRSIKPNKAAVERRAAQLPAGSEGIFGLQFENLILRNRPAVWRYLGIRAVDTVFDNPYWQTATRRTRGCQLDYVAQCRNNTVYVCEIKFSKASLPRAVIAEVDAKIRVLTNPATSPSVPSSFMSMVSMMRCRKPVISTPSLISVSRGPDRRALPANSAAAIA